jgi:hypothetical protein
MREIKRHIFVLLLAIFGVIMLVGSIVEYVAFLKTWEFSAIDLAFIATALVLFFVFLSTQLVVGTSKKPSWILAIGGLVLIIAWFLADVAIFPKGSRLSDLIDALSLLAFAGPLIGWASKSWLRGPKAITEDVPS